MTNGMKKKNWAEKKKNWAEKKHDTDKKVNQCHSCSKVTQTHNEPACQIWILWKQSQSHQWAVSKRPLDQPAVSWQIGTPLENFQEPFSKNSLIYSIVLLCSLHTFPSQRFWNQLLHLIKARMTQAHSICNSNAQENKGPFLSPKVSTVAFNLKNVE